MSFSISFHAPTKEEAKARIDQERSNPHFPKVVADAVNAAIDGLPENGNAVTLSCYGTSTNLDGSAKEPLPVVEGEEPKFKALGARLEAHFILSNQ